LLTNILPVETKLFGLYRYFSAGLVSPSWGDCSDTKSRGKVSAKTPAPGDIGNIVSYMY
jgi:hypothetical protein